LLILPPRETETVANPDSAAFENSTSRRLDQAQSCRKATPVGDNAFARQWGYDLRPQNPVDLNRPVEVTLKDGLNWFSFTLNENLHVRLQSDKGLVGIIKAERVINYKTDFVALDLDMPLQPGKYFIGVRSLAGESAEGTRLTYSFRNIDVLAEKSPPTISLAPGETRLFRFTLPEQKIIGIGLRTQKEVVQARLYDSEWRLLNRGKQQFKALEKGDYYLWLHVPLNQDATVCTPILVGQKRRRISRRRLVEDCGGGNEGASGSHIANMLLTNTRQIIIFDNDLSTTLKNYAPYKNRASCSNASEERHCALA
jgi:hypothetical protein